MATASISLTYSSMIHVVLDNSIEVRKDTAGDAARSEGVLSHHDTY